jgi:hypothetical protein
LHVSVDIWELLDPHPLSEDGTYLNVKHLQIKSYLILIFWLISNFETLPSVIHFTVKIVKVIIDGFIKRHSEPWGLNPYLRI